MSLVGVLFTSLVFCVPLTRYVTALEPVNEDPPARARPDVAAGRLNPSAATSLAIGGLL